MQGHTGIGHGAGMDLARNLETMGEELADGRARRTTSKRVRRAQLYAALVLLMLTGVAIFAITSLISWLLLHRWHESAIRREN